MNCVSVCCILSSGCWFHSSLAAQCLFGRRANKSAFLEREERERERERDRQRDRERETEREREIERGRERETERKNSETDRRTDRQTDRDSDRKRDRDRQTDRQREIMDLIRSTFHHQHSELRVQMNDDCWLVWRVQPWIPAWRPWWATSRTPTACTRGRMTE